MSTFDGCLDFILRVPWDNFFRSTSIFNRFLARWRIAWRRCPGCPTDNRGLNGSRLAKKGLDWPLGPREISPTTKFTCCVHNADAVHLGALRLRTETTAAMAAVAQFDCPKVTQNSSVALYF